MFRLLSIVLSVSLEYQLFVAWGSSLITMKRLRVEDIDVDDIWRAVGRLGKFQWKYLLSFTLTLVSWAIHQLTIVFIGKTLKKIVRSLTVGWGYDFYLWIYACYHDVSKIFIRKFVCFSVVFFYFFCVFVCVDGGLQLLMFSSV